MSNATDKQIAFIEKLSDELGNDRSYNFATMTIQQASDIIAELLEQKDEADMAEAGGMTFGDWRIENDHE